MSQVNVYVNRLVELNKNISKLYKNIREETAQSRKEVSAADKELNKVLGEIERGSFDEARGFDLATRVRDRLQRCRAANAALARMVAIESTAADNYRTVGWVIQEAEKMYQQLLKTDDAIRQIAN